MWSQEKYVPPPPQYNQPPPPSSYSNGHSAPSKKRYDPEDDDEEEFVGPVPAKYGQPAKGPAPPTNTSGIDFSQYDDIPVECSGRSPVAPISLWRDIDLGSTIQKNIDDAKYTKPTPVQRYSLPIVLNGRDLMSCAQTGSGKTAAFLLPCIVNLTKANLFSQSTGGYGRKATPYVLVIAPTRELAIQIFDECKKFSAGTRLKACILYGGAPMGGQLRDLERGCDVIIATPGRLTDVMDRGKVSLANVKFLILDEADRMLDMGFEPQIRRIVQKEDMPVTGKRQTLMFSATFPKEIQQLASQFLHDYLFLTIGRVGSTTELVTQKFVKVFDENDKQSKLLSLCSSVPGLTLIFVETKKKANNLDYYLKKNGFPSSSIHGDREQAEREAALRSFSTGRTPYLIATNVAARGLDISGVVHVINYDMAPNIDDYVHRIGRTGRAGKHGVSTTFITTDNAGVVNDLLKLLRDAKQEVPTWLDEMKYLRKPSGMGRGRGGYGGGYGGGNAWGGGGTGKKFGAKDFRQESYGQQAQQPAYNTQYGGYQNSYGYPQQQQQQPYQPPAPVAANYPMPPRNYEAPVQNYYGSNNGYSAPYPPAPHHAHSSTTAPPAPPAEHSRSMGDESKKRAHDDSHHRDSARDHSSKEHSSSRSSHRDSSSSSRDSHRDRDSSSSSRDHRDSRESREDRDRKHRKTDHHSSDDHKSSSSSSRDRSHY